MAHTSEAANNRRITSNIFKGSVGNLIEWYDWYVYSAFAVYFSSQFFPEGDSTSQLLNTAAIFAVGFLMRYLSKHSLAVFGWYRIGLAVVLGVILLVQYVQ